MESMAIAHPRFFHYILIAHFKILIAHLIFNLATVIAWYNPTGLRTVGLYLILTWPTGYNRRIQSLSDTYHCDSGGAVAVTVTAPPNSVEVNNKHNTHTESFSK